MSFARTEEQRMLADMLAAAVARGAAGWEALVVANGLDLLGVPADRGGLGDDLRDAAVVAEAFGLANAALPFAERWVEGADAPAEARIVLRCAELVGLCATMLRDAALYAKERRQFGAPIASFQVLRHRMADMAMWLEQARAITDAAIDAPTGRLAAAARVVCEDAARSVGEGAVQIHGAMGLTAELRLGGYFRRARALMQEDGGARPSIETYAA